MQFKTINTKRLKLRLCDNDALNFIFNNYSDHQLMDFFGISTDEELAKEKFRFKKGYTTFNRTFLYFHLLDQETDKVIGWCGYHTWYTDHDRAELGYGLYSDEWKQKGLMTEAMSEIIPYGFEFMNLHRIEALIGSTNIASFKVLDKFGFQKEGVLREHYFTNDQFEDSIIFSLLRKV